MTSFTFFCRAGTAALALGLGFAAAPATADVSFEGKTIKIIINSKPGGGTDANARQIGARLIDHLPGKPQVVFQNLPGGSGIKANNYFFAKVKGDGLTALSGSRTQVSPYKLRHKSVKYDPSKYRFVGGTARLGTVVLINKDPKTRARLLDPKAKPLAFGATDGERTGDHAAVWGKEYLGWNLKFVLGYAGTSEMLLAARRGEVDMVNNQTVFNVKPLLDSNMMGLVQLGNRDESGKFVERAEFKGIPVLGDLLAPKLDAKAKKAYAGWLDDQIVEKWIALPAGTPDDYVEAWRAAYAKVMKDPKFLEIVRREFGGDFGWYGGKQMDGIVKNLVATTDEELSFFISLRKKHGLPVQ
jgi:tripartite-type tricarboxylate transporter receptor subunit TctC